MPAYWLARSKINDPVEYKRYTDLVPDILARFNGKVLARGGRHEHLEGDGFYVRHVVGRRNTRKPGNFASTAWATTNWRSWTEAMPRRSDRLESGTRRWDGRGTLVARDTLKSVRRRHHECR